MIRTSKHNISKDVNILKSEHLNRMFSDYKNDLETYIKYIIDGNLPIKTYLTSKDLPTEIIKHSRYKQLIYKQASEIIRSQIVKANNRRYNKYKKVYSYFINNSRQIKFTKLKYSELKVKNLLKSKYFTIPVIKNLSINLDERFFDIKNGNHFDNFIKIILPYFNEKGTRGIQIKVPLKQHKHSNNFKNDGYALRKNIQIKSINNKYIISLIWEKQNPEIKEKGNSIGIDIGVNKMIVTSDNQFIGNNLKNIYIKLKNKKHGSNSYRRTLTERTNLTNQNINKLNINNINKIIIEDLKNVKYKSSFKNQNKKKFTKKKQKELNEINSYWLYPLIINKIERTCEVNGIELVKVSPSYTSQTCSKCGSIREESRKNEDFKCIDCGYEIDADYNASINIHNRGVYSLSN